MKSVKSLLSLQEGEFERVGGTKTLKVDVRLVTATNKTLIDEVKAGRFREDLYYRINVIYIKVPPLRERKEDIPLLVESFVKHFAFANGKKITTVDTEAMDALVRYDWPGNIRELKNIIERMVVLSNEEIIHLPNVPEDIRAGKKPEMYQEKSNEPISLSVMEKEHIKRVLDEVRGNKSLAAKKLGISRRTLYRKLDEYQLDA
jgi:transcriptional regulator with PAS, ATPase and Fis domain